MSHLFDNFWKIHNDLVATHFVTQPQALLPTNFAYHYTSLESAVAILESGKLRFTSARYLNDPREIEEGLQIAREVFFEKIISLQQSGLNYTADLLFKVIFFLEKALRKPSEVEDVIRFWKQLFHINEQALRDHTLNVYVASFSLASDSLGQWLAYSSSCRGAALGFSLDENEDSPFLTNGESVYWATVNYSENTQKKRFAEELLTLVVKEITLNGTQDKELEDEELERWWWRLTEILILDVVACKTSAYAEEREFRFIYPENPNNAVKKFIVKNDLIKPYIEFDIKKSCLREFVLGCRVKGELNHRSALELCKQNSFEKCEIRESKLAFRG